MALPSLSAHPAALPQLATIQPIPSETYSEQILPSFPDLTELICHRDQVDAQASLASAQKMFQDNPGDYRAIVEGSRVVGLCSRTNIGCILGSRFGFALYGNSSVLAAKAPSPLIYPSDTPLARVLDEALSRKGSDFFEDIILVDQKGDLAGLVPVPNLARVQLRLFDEQLSRVVAQDKELRTHNLGLFQINHQLRQSEGRYRVLFENNALGVALLDTQGGMIAHNPRFAQLLEMSEPPAPSTCLLGQWISPEELPTWLALLAKHESEAPKTEPKVTELTFALPSGSKLFKLHTSWVIETGQICVFLEDITEAHLLGERMAQQEKQSTLDTLVGGVAHELNNKLTPVMGFAELLHALAPSHLQEHTRCIRKSAEEAAQIIRQLLNLARPNEVASVLFDVFLICREAVQMLRFQLRDAKCEATIQPPPQAAYAQGDPAQIKQVLINLVLNALHAMEGMPEPRLTISIAVDRVAIRVRVRDTGSGIKPEIQNRIFDPFFTTKGTRGTGLGLSISSSIVRQHGGKLTVESVLGKGATFTICLPASNPSVTAATTSAPPMPTPQPVSATARGRVLVVDDEEFVRQFMQEALRRGFGCSVETAVDGADAVRILTEGSFDLILSDIRMPRMDGLQLRSWLAGNRPELAERVVFVTGHPGTAELNHALETLGCQVIRKPFTIEAILSVCRPYLQRDFDN